MTDDEVRKLEAEAAGETPEPVSAKTAGSDSLGNAFEAAFANVEWQPGN